MVVVGPEDIAKVLGIGITGAYKVINELQVMQKKEGYYAIPKKRLPIKYFCDKMNLDVDEVKDILSEEVA